MLKIAIRDLQRGPVETDGELSPSDPVFAGLDLPLDGPVVVEGQLQATEGDDFLWRGDIRATAQTPAGAAWPTSRCGSTGRST